MSNEWIRVDSGEFPDDFEVIIFAVYNNLLNSHDVYVGTTLPGSEETEIEFWNYELAFSVSETTHWMRIPNITKEKLDE